MAVTVNQENEFKALLVRSRKLANRFIDNGHKCTEEEIAEMVQVALLYVELDPTGELLDAEKYKQLKLATSQKATIREVRLSKGLTIQAAAILSGLSKSTVLRWEKKGCGRVNPYMLVKLLDAYKYSFDLIDFQSTSTNKYAQAVSSSVSA